MRVALTIDGKMVHAEHGSVILEAARKLDIHIPTLCFHEALSPYGACRLCVVEVVKRGWSKLVTSCNYPVEDGLIVYTSSETVLKVRKMVLELLLTKCPNVSTIRQMAQKMGIKESRFKRKEDQRCILCGLCVRACDEIAVVRAIGFSNRGTEREISTPFYLDSDICIGCGACTYICPTGCIEMADRQDKNNKRYLKMGDLELDTCPNNHACDTCDVDKQFIEEMKKQIKRLRC